MKRSILFVLSIIFATTLLAQEAEKPDMRGYGDNRYSLSVLGGYEFNKTWGSTGNLNVKALMPVNPYVELEGKVQLSTANVYTMAAVVRPKFVLPVGELFTNVEVSYRALKRSNSWDFVTALSLGYRMDYVSAEIGFFSRVMDVYKRDWHSENSYNCEPFNMLYRVRVNTRPRTENWNLWLALTNVDDFLFERAWAPFIQLGAHYDVDSHWRVNVETELKLAGMFHMNAELYSAYVKAGFSYRF